MSRPGPIHSKPHPLRGKNVTVQGHAAAGSFRLVDWFDRELQDTWNNLRDYNKLATGYVNRRHLKTLPKDDEVVIVLGVHGPLAVHATEVTEK